MAQEFTEEEYDILLGWLKPSLFKTEFPVLNEILVERWKNLIRRQFKSVKIPDWGIERPNKIKKLSGALEKDFEKGLVSPGYRAGSISGASIGENSTQFVLKIKGVSGTNASGKAINLMAQFESMINASTKPKVQRIELRFLENYSFTELYLSRRQFQSLTLGENGLIVDANVLSSSVLTSSDWYELFQKHFPLEFEIPENDIGLRITFNAQLLYNYQLLLEEIADSLADDRWFIIFSPQSEATIDVFLKPGFTDYIITAPRENIEKEDEENIEKEDEENIEKEDEEEEEIEEIEEIEEPTTLFQKTFFLRIEVLARLKLINFGEVPTVPEVSVAWDPISALILSEKIVNENVELTINQKVLREKGIPIKQLTNFLIKNGWEIVWQTEKKIVVFNRDSKRRSPIAEINQALEDPNKINYVIKPYIEAMTGFRELVLLPGVDIARSTTDALKPMKALYGIEASRNTFLREIGEMLQGDLYVSPIHLLLSADFMTASGEVVGLNRFGHGRAQNNPFARAGFEEALPSLLEGAMFPEQYPLSTLTSIFVGRPPPGGSAFSEVITDPEYERARKKIESQTIETVADQIEEELSDLIVTNRPKESVQTPEPDINVSTLPVEEELEEVEKPTTRSLRGLKTPSISFTSKKSSNLPKKTELNLSVSQISPLLPGAIGPPGTSPRTSIPDVDSKRVIDPTKRLGVETEGAEILLPKGLREPGITSIGLPNFRKANKLPPKATLSFGTR